MDRPCFPNTSVVKSILAKPESPVHVNSRTQLQNVRYQIRRSNQVSTAENNPQSGLVELGRANAN